MVDSFSNLFNNYRVRVFVLTLDMLPQARDESLLSGFSREVFQCES